MGINTEAVRCIIYAKKKGADFKKVATIGRQSLRPNNETIKDILKSNNIKVNVENFTQDDGYSETFFKALGAKMVDSFDYSDYEKATFIHDMNEPVPNVYKEKYSVVIDGGSLEHVFNFPVAIKNCMEMLEVGGVYIGMTPVNAQSGHGFYQISPELYFRVFSQENGFEIIDVLAFKTKHDFSPIYKLKDPKEIGQRLTIGGLGEANLCVIAKKIEKKEIFKQWPLQSDYQAIWENKQIDAQLQKNKFSKFANRLCKKFFRYLKKRCPIIIEPYTAYEVLDL